METSQSMPKGLRWIEDQKGVSSFAISFVIDAHLPEGPRTLGFSAPMHLDMLDQV